MIGLIVGTSEGKELLEGLNKFTEDIFVSTATNYGGDLLKGYKYKFLNTKPLNKEELKNKLEEYGVRKLIDASHPYALEVSINAMEAAKELSIEYIRYERPSVIDKYRDNRLVNIISDYSELKSSLSSVKGNVLNTTGSRNIKKILDLKIENRMIHRVLASLKVMEELCNLGIEPEDIIAVKGVFSEEFNRAVLREYKCDAIIMKDSGVEGGTVQKVEAALKENVKIVVIGRKQLEYKRVFTNINELITYVS
ncbi:cobalt-precorrin-6A reductase [Clostridium sp. 'White wine YQ']|uniref:cobalt-precorrin-6A reductase n=1 Tax=Clostridium sp. 'White wine YQ' TaxID=3027474 RepID=UPI002366D047|nr:cobalt-precorrin-6A reductase [Clostridium sp. 'White wine YQ']MDD7795229.1 cobalt-precorrin-6A reductase [Clostridium sp. 'White wine YQ']